jgi:hypothetical protein
MAAPRSSSSSSGIDARFRALERRVARLEEDKAVAEPPPGRWERPRVYAQRRNISIRTVERMVDSGLLEKKREGAMVFVRDKPGSAPALRRRGRPPAPKNDDVPVLITGSDPTSPQWPYVPMKEPPSG